MRNIVVVGQYVERNSIGRENKSLTRETCCTTESVQRERLVRVKHWMGVIIFIDNTNL